MEICPIIYNTLVYHVYNLVLLAEKVVTTYACTQDSIHHQQMTGLHRPLEDMLFDDTQSWTPASNKNI